MTPTLRSIKDNFPSESETVSNSDMIDWSLTSLTWWCLGIIFACFIVSAIYIVYLKRKDRLTSERRTAEYLPTFVSTLGVLGTFLGITIGLIHFNSKDLDTSIPDLLNGLKTAFFTSLAGMVFSIVLSWLLNKFQDKKDGGVSDINQAAGSICQAVEQMSDLHKTTIEKLAQQMEEQEKDRKAFYRTMGDVMEKIKHSQSAIAETLTNINSSQSSVTSVLDSIVILQRSQETSLTSLKEVVTKVESNFENSLQLSQQIGTNVGYIAQAGASLYKLNSDIAEDIHHVTEIHDIVAGMSATEDSINDQILRLKDILDAEVDQIEQSMDKTNGLLERKFDEFTELLKKSNTEALVEVMKNVTDEFQNR